MKLIGNALSPYVRKVRVVMAEKKLDYQFVIEDVWSANTQIAESNPLGKIPCLVMEGGEALFDSRVIVEYLDTLSPVGKLIPGVGRERAEVKTWEALADGLLDAAVTARLEKIWPGRTVGKTELRSAAWIDYQMVKIERSLAAMAKGLGERAHCCGIHLSLADIAVGCALGCLDFRFPEYDWRSPHSALSPMNRLAAILPLSNVSLAVEVTSKKRAFEEAGLLFENNAGLSRALVTDSLFARERLGSTGLGHGVAIPHGRIKGLKQPQAALFQLAQHIGFDAPDEQPVNLLIFLLVPEAATQKHLEILSEIAEMLSDAALREQLQTISDPQQLHTLISQWQSATARA
jgi:glutathione S-transferase